MSRQDPKSFTAPRLMHRQTSKSSWNTKCIPGFKIFYSISFSECLTNFKIILKYKAWVSGTKKLQQPVRCCTCKLLNSGSWKCDCESPGFKLIYSSQIMGTGKLQNSLETQRKWGSPGFQIINPFSECPVNVKIVTNTKFGSPGLKNFLQLGVRWCTGELQNMLAV